MQECLVIHGANHTRDPPIDDNASRPPMRWEVVVRGRVQANERCRLIWLNGGQLSGDEATVTALLDSYPTSGNTCISCALRAGLQVLQSSSARADAHQVMLLLTDGKQTVVDPVNPSPNFDTSVTYEANIVKAAGVTLFTVGFASADGDLLDEIASTPASAHLRPHGPASLPVGASYTGVDALGALASLVKLKSLYMVPKRSE